MQQDSHQDVKSSSALIAQGKWRQVWSMALARAANLQAKREKNPSTARQRSTTEKAKYAHNAPQQRLQGLQDSVSGNYSRMQ